MSLPKESSSSPRKTTWFKNAFVALNTRGDSLGNILSNIAAWLWTSIGCHAIPSWLGRMVTGSPGLPTSSTVKAYCKYVAAHGEPVALTKKLMKAVLPFTVGRTTYGYDGLLMT